MRFTLDNMDKAIFEACTPTDSLSSRYAGAYGRATMILYYLLKELPEDKRNEYIRHFMPKMMEEE